MSRQNKANKTNYMQAGRLSQDDMARERQKQVTAAPRGAARRTAPAAAKRVGEGGPAAPKPKGEGG